MCMQLMCGAFFMVDALAMRTLVPLYIFPSVNWSDLSCIDHDSAWSEVAKGGGNVIAVINPSNGPVQPTEEQYAPYISCMHMLAMAGVEMIGYVPSKAADHITGNDWNQRGLRDLDEIKDMLMTYADHYGGLLSGIFVDEVSNWWQVNDPTHPDADWANLSVPFYRAVFEEVRNATPAPSHTQRVQHHESAKSLASGWPVSEPAPRGGDVEYSGKCVWWGVGATHGERPFTLIPYFTLIPSFRPFLISYTSLFPFFAPAGIGGGLLRIAALSRQTTCLAHLRVAPTSS